MGAVETCGPYAIGGSVGVAPSSWMSSSSPSSSGTLSAAMPAGCWRPQALSSLLCLLSPPTVAFLILGTTMGRCGMVISRLSSWTVRPRRPVVILMYHGFGTSVACWRRLPYDALGESGRATRGLVARWIVTLVLLLLHHELLGLLRTVILAIFSVTVEGGIVKCRRALWLALGDGLLPAWHAVVRVDHHQ